MERWEIIAFVCCSLWLLSYFGQRIDFENILKPDSPVPVHIDGKIGKPKTIPHVKKVPIPEYVYQSLYNDTKFKRYLTGNQKYIILFTYNGCPYVKAYENGFRQHFEQDNYGEYYRKRIINVGRVVSASCPNHTMECATIWVYQNCFGNLCIVNPVAKQVIVDESHDAKQLGTLLNKYKEW